MKVNVTNYTITTSFSRTQEFSPPTFTEVRDTQFIGNTLYLIFDEYHSNSTNPFYIASIYSLTYQNSNITSTTYHVYNFVSSITIYNTTLYAYSQMDNIIYVFDLVSQSHSEISKITSPLVDNFTLIRSVDKYSFLLGDFSDGFYQCSQTAGTNPSLFLNGSFIGLTDSHSSYQMFYPSAENNAYTVIVFNNYQYLVTGYLFDSQGNKIGFGLDYTSFGKNPNLFVDSTKSFNVSSTLTSSTSTGGETELVILVGIVVGLLVIISGIVYYTRKNKATSPKLSKLVHDINSTKSNDPIMTTVHFCKVCGNQVLVNDIFCQNCGNRI